MVVGNHDLQGRQPSPWGRSPVSFEQIGPDSVFFRGSQVKGPSSLALLRMVPHQWPVALAVIWHIYLCLACSLEDSARDIPSSGKVVLVQGQISCEFWADQPGFSFSGKELRQGSFQPCPAQDGASSMVGGSRCDLAHLLTPVLFLKRMVVGTCHLQGRQPLPWGRSPVSFRQIGLGLVFQRKNWDKGPSNLALPRMVHCQWPGGSWHDLAHLLWAVLLQGGFRYGPVVFRGCCPHHGAGPLWVLSSLVNLHFSAGGSWHDLAHLLRPVLLLQGWF